MITIAVTRKDVAEKAGVSTATVSHVINGTKYVSEKLQQRVRQAIKELDYKPNMIAKSLSTRKSRQVAIVVNDITNPHYSEMVLGFEEEARKHGYVVNVCVGNKYLEQYFDEFYSRQLDGMFLGATLNKITGEIDKLYKLLDNGMVLATANYNFSVGKCSSLNIDYQDSMKQIFKYLIDQGHKNIGYISYSNPEKEDDNFRYICYKNCLESYNLKFNNDNIVFGENPYNSSDKEGYNYMKNLIKRDTDITAVIIPNDYMAVGALEALEEKGIKIPEELSLVTFDDTILARVSRPKLTSVNVDQRLMGIKAMELINKMITGNENHLTENIPAKLIIRESTGPVI